ncbi:MAG TPA: hypothetical protein VJA22_01225 [Patescibacteria group bacterium]|nr:hypothetical protein [Patescibacteria group bacterium]
MQKQDSAGKKHFPSQKSFFIFFTFLVAIMYMVVNVTVNHLPARFSSAAYTEGDRPLRARDDAVMPVEDANVAFELPGEVDGTYLQNLGTLQLFDVLLGSTQDTLGLDSAGVTSAWFEFIRSRISDDATRDLSLNFDSERYYDDFTQKLDALESPFAKASVISHVRWGIFELRHEIMNIFVEEKLPEDSVDRLHELLNTLIASKNISEAISNAAMLRDFVSGLEIRDPNKQKLYHQFDLLVVRSLGLTPLEAKDFIVASLSKYDLTDDQKVRLIKEVEQKSVDFSIDVTGFESEAKISSVVAFLESEVNISELTKDDILRLFRYLVTAVNSFDVMSIEQSIAELYASKQLTEQEKAYLLDAFVDVKMMADENQESIDSKLSSLDIHLANMQFSSSTRIAIMSLFQRMINALQDYPFHASVLNVEAGVLASGEKLAERLTQMEKEIDVKKLSAQEKRDVLDALYRVIALSHQSQASTQESLDLLSSELWGKNYDKFEVARIIALAQESADLAVESTLTQNQVIEYAKLFVHYVKERHLFDLMDTALHAATVVASSGVRELVEQANSFCQDTDPGEEGSAGHPFFFGSLTYTPLVNPGVSQNFFSPDYCVSPSILFQATCFGYTPSLCSGGCTAGICKN